MRFSKDSKSEAALILVCIAGLATLCFIQFGCTPVKGFNYTGDGPLSPYAARQAADVARAEADALDSIADRDSEAASGLASAASNLADSLGAPAAVGGILGALATLWVPPPGTRKKKKEQEGG
tara:strand:- start:1374 stop:1742 length:369 start_codon:yes stop_codon:yes gene_type:complete